MVIKLRKKKKKKKKKKETERKRSAPLFAYDTNDEINLTGLSIFSLILVQVQITQRRCVLYSFHTSIFSSPSPLSLSLSFSFAFYLPKQIKFSGGYLPENKKKNVEREKARKKNGAHTHA